MEPGSDHIGIYLRILILIACIAILFYYCGGGKKSNGMVVGLDDVTDASQLDKSEKKSTKRSSKGSSRSETKESTNAANEEAEYRTMSLKREMDRKGPYLLTEDQNMLQRDSFVKACAIMQKHTWIKFGFTYGELLENRYSLYQDRRMKDYDKSIST